MNFKPLTIADLFQENGNVAVFCCRSWRDGGPCFMPARLMETAIPQDERQQFLNFANNAGWAKDDEGQIHCPSCTEALGRAKE